VLSNFECVEAPSAVDAAGPRATSLNICNYLQVPFQRGFSGRHRRCSVVVADSEVNVGGDIAPALKHDPSDLISQPLTPGCSDSRQSLPNR
jgi:hypothetical protein